MCTSCGHTRNWNNSTNCCSCGCRRKYKGEPGIQGRPGIAGANGLNAPTSQIVTAYPTGGQGNATITTASNVLISVVGTAGDSVLANAAVVNNFQNFANRAGNGNSVNIFPPLGMKFDTLATNTAFALADGNNLKWYGFETGVLTII